MAFIAASYFNAKASELQLYRCTNFSGALYRFTTVSPIGFRRIHLPPATLAMRRLPAGANYGNRQYLVGGHSANILVDTECRAVRQSIPAPDIRPTVSVGVGTTAQICYTRFYDEKTGERSPLSDGLSVTGNTTRAWTVIPTEVPNERVNLEGVATIAAGAVTGASDLTNFGDLRPGDRIAIASALTRWAQVRSISSHTSMTIDDTGMAGVGVGLVAKTFSRVSHVELWVSVSGGLPRLAVRVRIGTTSLTESTATLALGQAETTSFGPMPRGDFNLFYNDRQLVAGIDEHRDTVYLSAIGFPERHEGLIFKTAYNEPIVGMFKYRDYVVLLCSDSSYRLQGYTEDDTVRTVLEPDIGGYGHHGNKIAEGRAYVPGRKGMQLFNGAFHQAIPTRLREWKAKSGNTIEGKLAYEDGFGVVNPNDETYRFFPNIRWYSPTNGASGGYIPAAPTTTIRTQPSVWVAQYNIVAPQAGGGIATPEWLSDSPLTQDGGHTTCAAYLTIPGEKAGILFHGTSQGRVYGETDVVAWTGSGADSVIVTAHLLMGDPGGSKTGEGKKLIRLWSYIYCESTAGSIRVWPGDEYSYAGDVDSIMTREFPLSGNANTVTPSYSGTIKATGRSSANGNFQPMITHEHVVEKDGRGFTIEYRWASPKRVLFLGVGGEWAPGDVSRPLYLK